MLTIDGGSLAYRSALTAKRNEPIRRQSSYVQQTRTTAVTQLNYAASRAQRPTTHQVRTEVRRCRGSIVSQ